MAGDHPSRRTFELLANEIRLRIITALGDASGRDGYATLAFSEIQRAAEVEDSGKLSYHLGELRDEFVTESDEGYTLTLAGIRAYQAVIAHRSGPEVEVEPFDVGMTCDACGDGVEAWYTDGRAHIGCRGCGANSLRYPVDSARIDPADPASVTDALDSRLRRDHNAMFNGSCPYCGGRTESRIETASDHWEETEMRPEELLVHASCTDCSWFLVANVAAAVRTLEPVQAFFEERGVDLWAEPVWTEVIDWVVDGFERDPIRIRGSLPFEGDRLEVVLDGDLNLVDRRIVTGE